MGIFSKKRKLNENMSLGEIATILAEEGIIKMPEDDNHNSFGDPLDKLIDGELPFGWTNAKREFTQSIQAEFSKLQLSVNDQKSSPSDRVAALENMLTFIKQTQHMCDEKGECYGYWFKVYAVGELHERYGKELADMKADFDKLDVDYQERVRFEKDVLPTLKEDLIRIIKKNPGIMQKDLVKMYDPIGKNYISEILYFMNKEGKLKREKSGNSYKLSI